ncbi:MAG: hypothetical protein LBH43_02505 [Treponema sp.]|jgi:hypothetical protein|nr:hypothetical protein [Treponema sp.]
MTKKKKKYNLFEKMFSRQPENEPDTRKNPAMQGPDPYRPELKLVLIIVDWNKVKVISGVFENWKVPFRFISKGKGTASSEILDLLGIGSSDKAVIICLCEPETVPVLINGIREKLNFHSPGAGIAFSIPLSAVNNPILRLFKHLFTEPFVQEAASAVSEEENIQGSGKAGAKKIFSHALILSVVNHGYSDEFMNTAREAGAKGGTVLSARSQTHEGAVKFFGISVQDEREIILILSTQNKKAAIMQAVCDKHGLDSKAQGIVFSIPVESVMGLGFE